MLLLPVISLLYASTLLAHAGQIKSKYVTSSDGAQIYAQAVGNKNLPHILLIHGLGLSTAVFDGIFADKGFTSKAYVVGYDTRGHGRSAKPPSIEGHSSSLYAADYTAVAKEFGLSNPLFVGWSLGGVIASDILEHITPNPLAGIVYLNSFPALFNVADLNTQLVRDLLPGLTSQNNVTLSKASTVSFTEALFADSATVPFPILTSWIGQSTLQPPNQTAFVLTRPQNTTNLVAAGQAGLPVLFLFGRGDRVLDGEKNLEFLGTWFTNITVNWINHGSHASFYDNQTYVEHALLDFADFVHDH